MNKILLLDADSLCYYPITINTLEEAKDFIDDKINKIKLTSMCDNIEYYLTIGRCFRYDILPTYKEQRFKTEKPKFTKQLKQYLIDVYDAVYDSNLEADDMVCDKYRSNPSKYIIGSIDKDVLYNIPGIHFNLFYNEYVKVNEYDSEYHFYKQIVCGDPTDNIKPLIKMLGEKRFELLVEESESTLFDIAQYICNRSGEDFINRYKLIYCGDINKVDIELREYELIDGIEKYICFKEMKFRKRDKAEFNKDQIIPFGKYKGKNIKDIYMCDNSYFNWLAEKSNGPLKNEIDRIIRLSIPKDNM